MQWTGTLLRNFACFRLRSGLAMWFGMAYRGVADAFPDEKRQSLVLGKRAYKGRPDPTCSLKRIKLAIAFDGRIDVRTCSEPLEKSCYPMASNPRGICLIINNLVFHDKDTEDRYGGERDEKVLHQLFQEELGFVVKVFHDLQYFEMQQKAEEFAKLDHSNYDAFICIIMSHGGEKDTIEGVKGRKIYIENITSEFKPSKCPTLAEKPKVFIVQACRGRSEDQNLQPIHLTSADGAKSGLFKDSTLPRSVTPEESDFLYAFSTVPGYVSLRFPDTGSPFIQTLVDVIKKYHEKEHFSDMLTIVNRHLIQCGIQVSAPTSSLRYKLFL